MTTYEKLENFTLIHEKGWGILGNYAIPQQNKISNFRPLILEEQGKVSHFSWGVAISQLTPQFHYQFAIINDKFQFTPQDAKKP